MTADDFRSELAGMFDAGANAGRGTIVVRAGDLHRAVGGYPGSDHRMTMCCNVMYAEMVDGGRRDPVGAAEGPGGVGGDRIPVAAPRPRGTGERRLKRGASEVPIADRLYV